MKYSDFELTKNGVRVLKYFLQPFWSWSRPGVTIEVLADRLKIRESDISFIVDRLSEFGLVGPDLPARVDPEKKTLEITNLGRNYLEFRRDILREKLVWSMFIPAVISFITAFVTVLLSH